MDGLYAVMLVLALVLNGRDRRMLALTAVIGVSVFIPVPRATAFEFYSFCMAAELVVALLAWRLDAKASELIISFCIVLELTHIMGYILDGYPPLSSYRIMVPILETAQLAACIAMSPMLYERLRNRIA